MPNRMIASRSRSYSVQLADTLSSLFALELMSPGKDLYLISPWITDMPLLSNRAGQFRSIMPELTADHLGLADVLNELAQRGTTVRIICRQDQTDTQRFLYQLTPSIAWRHYTGLHEKGLISRHFYLRGSMNFTYSGVYINAESVELTTDVEPVARAFLEAQSLWENLE